MKFERYFAGGQMAWESIVLTVVFTTGLLVLYLKTFVKSTVEESIRHQFEVERQKMREDFAREQETRERKDKFRLAALDDKLEKHQRAYALSRKILNTLFSEEDVKMAVQREFTEFWDSSCLYLSKEAREALWTTVIYYGDYKMYWHAWQSKPHGDAEKRLQNVFDHIVKTGDVIAAGVDLEAMSVEDVQIGGKKITPFGTQEAKEISK